MKKLCLAFNLYHGVIGMSDKQLEEPCIPYEPYSISQEILNPSHSFKRLTDFSPKMQTIAKQTPPLSQSFSSYPSSQEISMSSYSLSQPQECADQDCYPPQYYSLECDWGLFSFLDFLYWYAKESNLSYALEAKTIAAFENTAFDAFLNIIPKKNHYVEESWDPGFRIGIGTNTSCDGWDILLDWTYFHTNIKDSISVEVSSNNEPLFPIAASLFSPWIIPNILLTTSNTSTDFQWFSKISAKWRLNFNLVDLELGRNFWLSPCFSLRPFIGLRGTWIKINFSTEPTLDAFTTAVMMQAPTFVDIVHFVSYEDPFWGVGILGGLQPNWHFGCGFSIFGTSDFSLLWGFYDESRNEKVLLGLNSPNLGVSENALGSFGEAKQSFSDMQAILDLGIGIRFESTFCCNRYRGSLDLGWEQHIWFDFVHRFQLRGSFETDDVIQNNQVGQSFINYDLYLSNLILGGPFVRARFDF